MATWYLEGYFSNDSTISKQAISEFPVTMGRDQTLNCRVLSPGISRQHARLEERTGQLWIVDLDSRNGTHVNRKRIDGAMPVNHGDVIHLGKIEFRLIDQNHLEAGPVDPEVRQSSETVFMPQSKLSETFPFGVNELEELIVTRAVEMVFQPIVNGRDLTTCGYEVLGRGKSAGIPKSPVALFKIAESVGLEIELSELMRNSGVDDAASYGLQGDILVNSHPRELEQTDRLITSLRLLRRRHPNIPLVFEVHEQGATDVQLLRELKEELQRISIRFAFDDFGVGQSRLMELIEAKPDIIKFDKELIEGIDRADQSRINLLRNLKEMVSDLSITTLAECVENEGEYLQCKAIGFELYQGYHFGRPMLPDHFSPSGIHQRAT